VSDIVEESSKFLLEIITLVSSATEMGPDKLLIVGGRSLIYIMKSNRPKLDPWGSLLLNHKIFPQHAVFG
jgi:hypothetical protein